MGDLSRAADDAGEANNADATCGIFAAWTDADIEEVDAGLGAAKHHLDWGI